MKKVAAVAVSIGVILVIIGLVLVGIYGRDKITSGELFAFGSVNLNSANAVVEKQPHELTEVQSISINVASYNVFIRPSETDNLSVKYIDPLEEGDNLSVEVINSTFKITQTGNKTSHWGFSWFTRNRFIAVYIPQTEQFKQAKIDIFANASSVNISDVDCSWLNVHTQAGSVNIDNLNAGIVAVETNAGSVHVDDLTANEVDLHTSAGSINLDESTCNTLWISTDAGSVKATDIEATTRADIKVSAGSVKCDIDTVKLVIDSSAGSINFETNASIIELSSNAGSITGTVDGYKSEYQINVKQGMGSSNISNQTVAGAVKSLKVVSDMGSIKIKFEND